MIILLSDPGKAKLSRETVRNLTEPKTHACLALVAILTAFLSGCSSFLGLPSYYDLTTYKNLTDLKPEVHALYDTFLNDTVDQARIAAIRLKLAQAYEYENGKGQKNAETTEQLQIIQRMFERHADDRMTSGKWTVAHLNNEKNNIGEAFDIAISTERLKNKNE